MVKKLLVLALLIPGTAGCIISEEGGHHGHHRDTVVVAPVHAHCVGCHHVYRGGVWVVAR